MLQPDTPTWKAKLRAARVAVLDALSPEESESRAAADLADREARAERRAARSAQALLINQRLSLGDTLDEIAGRLGITVGALRLRARRWGYALRQRKGFRWLSAWVSERHVATLDGLAASWGVSREKALEEVLSDALAARAQRRAAA